MNQSIDYCFTSLNKNIKSEEIVLGEDLLDCSPHVDVQLLRQYAVLLPQFGVFELSVSQSGFEFVQSE